MSERPSTIRRAQKDRAHPYTIIRRSVLEDDRLSFESRGALCYLLAKPDDWEVGIGDLRRAGNIGRDKAYKILNELIEHGYCLRIEHRDDSGRIVSYRYEISEEPMIEQDKQPLTENPEADKPLTDLPYTDLPDPEKPLTANTDHTNKEVNTKYDPLLNTKNTKGVEDLDGINAAGQPHAAEPAPPPVLQSYPIDLGDYNNFDGPKPQTQPALKQKRSTGKTGAVVTLYDPRKFNGQKLVAAGKGATACEVLFEFVPYDPRRISPATLDLVDREVKDLDKWRCTLAEIDGRGWNIYNIADRLKVYHNGFERRNGAANGHKTKTPLHSANGAYANGSAKSNPLYEQFA